MRRSVLLLAGGAIVVGLAMGLARVSSLESTEVAFASDLQTLGSLAAVAPTHELARAPLAAGQRAVFEICARDDFDLARWGGQVSFDIWYPADDALVLSTPFDERLEGFVKRGNGYACAKVADSPGIEPAGEYALGVGWQGDAPPAALAEVPLSGRILAVTPLGGGDRLPVYLTLLGALLLLVGWLLPRPAPSPGALEAAGAEAPGGDEAGASAEPSPGKLGYGPRLALGLVALVLAGVGVGLLPLPGTAAGMGRGIVLALVQAALGVGLVVAVRPQDGRPPSRSDALGLVRPRGGLWVAAAALPLAVVVWLAGSVLMQLVPSTGEAPIETFVSMPSGRLAYAVVAVVVPVAEELFFRGFVYGTAARRFGDNAATLVAIVLFAIAHLPQQWGAWGPFASVLFTGVVLTLLRRATGSTLVPAVAHVGHNAIITLLALA